LPEYRGNSSCADLQFDVKPDENERKGKYCAEIDCYWDVATTGITYSYAWGR
jgi:hypothetical protein